MARGLKRGTLVGAIDIIALGRLQLLGHRVPEDFRVIGFDGVGVNPLAIRTPLRFASLSRRWSSGSWNWYAPRSRRTTGKHSAHSDPCAARDQPVYKA